MDIAALSIGMSGAKLQQAAGLMVLKKAMDQGAMSSASLLEIMPPPSGHRLDVRA